jgi:excisionase family DNA binding protein
MKQILDELRELKKLTLLGVKKALTVSDAELLTGLSENYICELVSSKKIPYHKSQGDELICFDKSELEEWMLRQRVDAVAPVDLVDKDICRVLNTRICDLGLSARVLNCLKIVDIQILADLVQISRSDIMRFRNFGKKSMSELEELLKKHNLAFGMDITRYYFAMNVKSWKVRNFYTDWYDNLKEYGK